MQEILDKIAAAPLAAKLSVIVGLVFAIVAGYWYFFYSDVIDEQARLEREGQALATEKQGYEKRKQEYLAFRNEVNALLEEQKELLRVLPKQDDIEQFIESIQSQVEFAGLSKVSSVREAAQPVDMYIKIPVKMALVGTYHQINRFFKNVGELKRIVNIEDMSLVPSDTNVLGFPPNQPVLLKANFTATTFQFVDRGTGKKPGAKGGK